MESKTNAKLTRQSLSGLTTEDQTEVIKEFGTEVLLEELAGRISHIENQLSAIKEITKCRR